MKTALQWGRNTNKNIHSYLLWPQEPSAVLLPSVEIVDRAIEWQINFPRGPVLKNDFYPPQQPCWIGRNFVVSRMREIWREIFWRTFVIWTADKKVSVKWSQRKKEKKSSKFLSRHSCQSQFAYLSDGTAEPSSNEKIWNIKELKLRSSRKNQ